MSLKDPSLYDAVSQFAALLYDKPDENLDRSWAWQSYDFEGVRFALFRTYEELNTLALTLSSARSRAGQPITPAQHILAHYHAAYRDLEAILLGLGDEEAEIAPGTGEWSVRDTLSHIVQAELGFYVVCHHALERFRHGDATPVAVTEAERERLIGMDESAYERLLNSPLSVLQAYHAQHHDRVLAAFAGMERAAMAVPSIFWEHEAYSLQFRLFRFDSHLRQHAVQIAKTLVVIRREPSEAQRILRLVFNALAGAEASALGFEATHSSTDEAAALIMRRVQEIQVILDQ